MVDNPANGAHISVCSVQSMHEKMNMKTHLMLLVFMLGIFAIAGQVQAQCYECNVPCGSHYACSSGPDYPGPTPYSDCINVGTCNGGGGCAGHCCCEPLPSASAEREYELTSNTGAAFASSVSESS